MTQLVMYKPPATLPPEEIEILKRKGLIDDDWEEMCEGPAAPPFFYEINGSVFRFDSPHRPFKRERRKHSLGFVEDRKGNRLNREAFATHTAWVPDNDRSAFKPRNSHSLSDTAVKMLRTGKWAPLNKYMVFLGDDARRLNDHVQEQAARHEHELKRMQEEHQRMLAEAQRQLQEELNEQAAANEEQKLRLAKEGKMSLSELKALVEEQKARAAEASRLLKDQQKKAKEEAGGPTA